MNESVGLNALRVDLGDWVDRVHYTGAQVTITKKGKPWAMIVPITETFDFARGGMLGTPNPDDPLIMNDCNSGLGWIK